MTSAADFDAFISYRRSDGQAVARWLRRKLQDYVAPRSLPGLRPRRLKIYLDTIFERGTTDFFVSNIRPALLRSRYLIVVATPDAVRRRAEGQDWIEREIAEFSEGPNGSNVLAVRGAGGLTDPLPGGLLERFPNIEIVDLRGAGRFAGLNPVRSARLASEKLKLIGPLLDVAPDDMPLLRQDEERRQQIRAGLGLGVGAGVLAAVSGLSVVTLQSRNEAQRALGDSLFATGSMVMLSSGLGDANRSAAASDARTRRLLINQGCDLLDKLAGSLGQSAGIDEAVTCRIERGRQHEQMQERALAGGQFRGAIELARAAYERQPRAGPGEWLVAAERAYGDFLARVRDPQAAEALDRAVAAADRLLQKHRDNTRLLQARGSAREAVAHVAVDQGRHAVAAKSFAEAADDFAQLAEGLSRTGARVTQARLLRQAAEQWRKAGEPAAALADLRRSADELGRVPQDPLSPDIVQELNLTQAAIMTVELERGDRQAASAARDAVLRGTRALLEARGVSAEVRDKARGLARAVAGAGGEPR